MPGISLAPNRMLPGLQGKTKEHFHRWNRKVKFIRIAIKVLRLTYPP
jgi:hypothetical protein